MDFMNLISKSLTNLCSSKRKLISIIIVQVLKVDKNALSSLRAHVTACQSIADINKIIKIIEKKISFKLSKNNDGYI